MSGKRVEYEERKAAVAEGLRLLERRLAELTRALAHVDPTLAVQGVPDPAAAMAKVIDAYTAIDFVGEREDELPETVVGVVGVPSHVLERARAVNEAKDQFKQACRTLWERKMSAPVKDEKGDPLVKPMPWARLMLRELGRPRLSMVAAYRHIPLLESAPVRVGYVRAKSRSVYRRAREDLVSLLNESLRPEAAEDLARLRKLPPRERFLAEVGEHYDQIRVNVTLPTPPPPKGKPRKGAAVNKSATMAKVGKRKSPNRRQLNGALPILYDRKGCTTLPPITFPRPVDAPPSGKAPRRKLLKDEPYLKTLPVHRYVNPPDERYQR